MQTVLVDTNQVVQALLASGFNQLQAEAVTLAIRKVDLSGVASKVELAERKNEQDKQLSGFRLELKDYQMDMNDRFVQFESGIEQRMSSFEAKMEQRMSSFEAKMEQRMAEFEKRIEIALRDNTIMLIKWLVPILLAHAAMVVSLIKILP